MTTQAHNTSHGRALIDRDRCCLLLIDPLCGRTGQRQAPSPDGEPSHGLALLEAALADGVPLYLSIQEGVVAEASAWPALLAGLPPEIRFRRCSINPWDDEALRQAVAASEKSSIVLAGPWSEPALAQAALSALAHGYDVIAITDLEGQPMDKQFMTSLSRLTQAGVVPVSASHLLSEWQ